MDLFSGTTVMITIGLVIVVIACLIGLVIARTWIKVASVNEALVISGKGQKGLDGESYATTVVINGKALVNPISQRYELISLRSRQVSMEAEAQSNDNVTLSVEAVALVKIGSDPVSVRNAAERFAGQDKAIEKFTQDQLEGSLRGVIAQQSVISLMRDRKEFSDQIAMSVTPELEKQGLSLDSFQIRGITDDVGYIQSLGAPEIESKRQAAEISQTNAERAIAKERIQNEEKNLVEQTALDTNTANSDSEIGRARAQAEQAEALAGEKARQEVLKQQAENRQAQLDADVKRVADADRYKREQAAEASAFEEARRAQAQVSVAQSEAEAVTARAQADAEATRVEGQAKADAIRAEAEALRENQEAVLARTALEQLPSLMDSFARGYANIGEITVVGSGSGEDGDSLAGSQFSGESAVALRSVFSSVNAATGLDLASLIQGRVEGQATGEAIGTALRDANVQEPITEAIDEQFSIDADDSLSGRGHF